jgi:hypothetical protein
MHPPGAVIIPGQETARYHRFTSSLVNLELPPGSQLIFGIGTSIIQNLNDSIRALRDEDEWVWIVGDDHVFAPDALMRLLDREADMIAPLCTRRGPPFPLVHYGPLRRVIQLDDLEDDDEPFEVDVTGSLMLIRRHILDHVGDPWFTNTPGRMDEEFKFCAKVRAGGFKILVDPAVTVGHIGVIVTYPRMDTDGTWGIHIDYLGATTAGEFHPGGFQAEKAFT